MGEVLTVSGSFGLDTVVVPIPATLVDEIQLETPAELTILKFGIESTLDLSVTYWNMTVHLNTAMNIPGLERLILEETIPLGPIVIKPELWFAVPFETVTDINHFTNWVVIPPGDPMFVKMRCTTEVDIGGISVRNLLMIEDVTFPNPLENFGPLEYPVQSQSFHTGDILTLTAEPYPGITLTSVTNFCANAGTNAVKGWSASGSVDAESSLCEEACFNETLSIRGLQFCGASVWFSLAVNPCDEPILELSGGGSMAGLLNLNLSGSFSLLPLSITGFTFSTSLCDVIDASIRLSEAFCFESASLRGQVKVDTGIMQGTFFGSSTFINGEGVTGCSIGGTLTHGTISGGMTWAFAPVEGNFRLVSSTVRFGFNFAPATFSVSARFGRSGLVQGVLGVGLSF